MSVISLSIIGKDNTPVYLREFHDENTSPPSEAELFGLNQQTSSEKESSGSAPSCSLRQQFLLHAALDRFEQKVGPPPGNAWRAPGVTGTDAMFVGLLCPVEDMRIYGYMTTTQIKFIMVLYDDVTHHEDQKRVDDSIQKLFASVHRIYVGYTLNPFSTINKPIVSARFDKELQVCIEAYNQSRTTLVSNY